MKTIIEVTEKFLKKNDAQSFDKIWKHVFSEMKDQWKEQQPTMLLKNIEASKIGELHTLLTTTGIFARLLDSKYVLAESLTYEEIKKLRTNVETNSD